MASGPITSWEIDGETVSDFIFLGSKITADGDCSHEIKRHLLLGRKVMTNISLVQFSQSVVSDSLRPHESQHARPPCPSQTPRVYSNSCPSSRWCHPAISSSVDSILKSRDITLPAKVCLVKAMVFPVVMYGCELDCEESWAPINWCFWTVVLEKTLESPLNCKEIQPVHPKGDQSWVFSGRTDAEAETPILWPPHAKSWLIGKDPDAGRDWGQEEKGMTEDKMAGWHHQLDEHEFE